MQKRKALDSECHLEQKEHMSEEETHTGNIVDAMQIDMEWGMGANDKIETCVVTSNANTEDSKDKDHWTSLHPADISVIMKKEDILSTCSCHEEKHDVATTIDSGSTEVKTTASDHTNTVPPNGKSKSAYISLEEDPSSSLEIGQHHFSAAVLALPSTAERDMINKRKYEKVSIGIATSQVNMEGGHLSETADTVIVKQSHVTPETYLSCGDAISINSKHHKRYCRRANDKYAVNSYVPPSLPAAQGCTLGNTIPLSSFSEKGSCMNTTDEAVIGKNFTPSVDGKLGAVMSGAGVNADKSGTSTDFSSNAAIIDNSANQYNETETTNNEALVFNYKFGSDPTAINPSLTDASKFYFAGEKSVDVSYENTVLSLVTEDSRIRGCTDAISNNESTTAFHVAANLKQTNSTYGHPSIPIEGAQEKEPDKDISFSSRDVEVHDGSSDVLLVMDVGISGNSGNVPASDEVQKFRDEEVKPAIIEHDTSLLKEDLTYESDKVREVSSCDVELVHVGSSDVLQVMDGSIYSNSGNVTASDEVQKFRDEEVKPAIIEHDTSNDAVSLLNEGLTYESDKVREVSVISAEGNLKAFPSPIRGVIHDPVSLAEPNEKDMLNSFRKEENSFSFQTPEKFSSTESSNNHVGSNNTLPRIGKNDELNSTSSCIASGKTNGLESERGSLLVSHTAENSSISVLINIQDKKSDVILQPERNLASRRRRKLLVLDINGLLADIVQDIRNVHTAQKKVGGKAVFKRPFCDDFLKFCFETFDIGVWSSRRKYNVDDVIDFIMGDSRHKLLFCWDQSHCTYTGLRTLENVHKPLVLKELKKLWDKEGTGLPWKRGDYSSSNTLLVDDSPYKALRNPPNTAIFPYPYHFDDENDTSLGSGGDLRVYLEGLSVANDVQLYVQEHPFGQKAITNSDPSWGFYLQIIEKGEPSLAST